MVALASYGFVMYVCTDCRALGYSISRGSSSSGDLCISITFEDSPILCSVLAWCVLSMGLFSTVIISFFKLNITAPMMSGTIAVPTTDIKFSSVVFPFVISVANAKTML